MVVFSLYYFIVITTLLVQDLYSAGITKFEYNANPPQGYQRNAFPQSKDNTKIFMDLKQLDGAINHLLLPDHAILPKVKKREIQKHRFRIRSGYEFKEKPIFDKWSDWSPCSITCGKGREIRWRHCLRSCKGVETEMEEKICQLPACESKLFGFIKL